MPTLAVNGQEVDLVDVPEDMPLLWLLRDRLDLVGTKFGCGIAQCGACTVLVDGEARRSCSTRAHELDGRSVTTIEGLAGDDEQNLHPLQQAWIEEDVPQCGYCQAGQIMSAAALLARNAAPSDADIDDALAGNICRCGTYLRIRKAVRKAAETLASDATSREAGDTA